MAKLVMAHDVVDALQRSGVIDMPTDRLRRVVIDLTAGELPRLYTESFVDDRLVEALLTAGMPDLPPARLLPVEAWRGPDS